MARQLQWIALDCTGVPNKVATECVCSTSHAFIDLICTISVAKRNDVNRTGVFKPSEKMHQNQNCICYLVSNRAEVVFCIVIIDRKRSESF